MVIYHNRKKNYGEFEVPSDNQSIEEVSIHRAVQSTIQLLYDKGLLIVYLKLMRL